MDNKPDLDLPENVLKAMKREGTLRYELTRALIVLLAVFVVVVVVVALYDFGAHQ